MIEKINNTAWELIKLVSERIENERPALKNRKGSFNEQEVLDWSDKITGNGIQRNTNHIDETVAIYYIDSARIMGFDETIYPEFKKFTHQIMDEYKYSETVSFNYLEEITFTWIIDIYKSKKASTTLHNYLEDRILKDKQKFQFSFPIVNLNIEESFNIGNVEFNYYTKKDCDEIFQRWQKIREPISEEDFNEIFRTKYQGHPRAIVKVEAENGKAEEIAKSQAALAVDILKIYGITPIVPEKHIEFDLNFRLNYQLKAEFLSENLSNDDGICFNVKFNVHPFDFTKEQFESANKTGLKSFSKFLISEKKDELYSLIIQAIKMFGNALSERDLHFRIIQLFTILESLLLKDSETWDMKKITKGRIAKAISPHQNEREKIKKIVDDLYDVRNKMVHKAKRLPIEIEKLRQFQIYLINLLLKYIHLQQLYTDKESVINGMNENLN